jgi:ComF family protein
MPIRLQQRLNQALTITANLVHWLNPPSCLLCKQIHNLRQGICFHCEQALPRNELACGQCGLPLGAETHLLPRGILRSDRCNDCLRRPPHFRQTLAPFLMRGRMRDLIHLWKFQGQSQLTPQLGALFASAASHERFQSIPASAVLVPVPTQWYRQARRGFDHTWLLATALRWQLRNKPEVQYWLRNTRYRTPQHQRNRRTRMQATTHRFVAHPGVAGRHIILIDDVMTTGATARAAATRCAEGGARSITVWCLARTPLAENHATDALR